MGAEWGTNVVTKMVVYDNRGNELAAESVPLSFKGGFGKRLASIPFSVPTGYSGEITVELSLDYSYNQDNVSCNDWLDFAIDDLSITICGETMPKPTICIDGNDGLHLLSGFECTDETPHKVVMSGLNDLLKEYPDAAFIWQTSVDGGATWSNLSASSTSVDYEYTGNLETLYRVVIGETETVAEEVAATGRHKDECSVYYITNVVGFKCKESECRAPKFSFDADKEVKKIDTVFCAIPDAIDINVIQTNKVNVDDFYIAIMGADKKYEAAKVMSPAPTSTDNIWKISLDKKSANYMIYAINDTCKSDTLYINVDVREPIELKPVDDLMFCAIEVPTVILKITSGEAESVFLKYGSHEGKAEVTLSEAFVIFPDIAEIIGETEVSAYAESKDGKCKSETITFKMDYESIPDFTFDVDNNIICSGDKTELHLNIAEGHNSKNHKYEIEGSDGKPVDINNLVFFPTEGITYTVTATSDACQSIISREISLYVVLPIALNLETVPSPVLKTLGYEEAVCAPATVSFILKDNLNLTSWDWEYRKKGEKDFTKWETESTKTTNSFEVTEETSFRVTSKVDTEVCKNFSSFIITIKAENKPEFSLALDKDRICESGDIELSLLTKDSYDPSIITATANGNPITLNDNKYSANISETTKFEVTVSGEVCGETKFDTTAYVDHPLSFTLSADKTKICEGEDVTFTVTGETEGIVWYKSTDGNKYTEFTPESGNKITPDETIYVYAGTPSDGACGAFKVDPIKIEVEKPISFDLTSDVNGKICAGTEVNLAVKNLVGTPNSSKWEKNDIEINAVSSYKDTPVSTSTYKVTLNGDVCPSVEQEIEIEVESADALTLTADKSLICEGESVTLTKDYGTNDPASVTWWSETAGMRTKISETSTVAPSKSTSYYLSVKGSVCDEVYSQPAIVEVEPINDFTFTVENEMICEGNEVKLILGLKKFSSDENNFILTANDKELEESDYTSSIIVGVPDYIIMKEFTIHPTEPTTYELSMPGKVCKTETKSLDVKVQKQPKLSVTIDKTGICEGESVTITPTAENADDLIWKASEDDGNTFTDLTNSMSAQTFTPEKTSIYSITSAGSNVCEPAEWIQEIEVEKPISINFDQDIDTICKGWPVTLRANINGKKNMIDSYNTSYTFEWSKTINGKDYTSLQHYPHNFGAVDVEIDTNIVFRLIVTGKYCNSDTIYTTYLIDKVPTLDSVVVYPSDHICEGDEITIKAYFSSDNLKDVWFWGKYVNPDDWNWYEKEREKFGDANYNLSRAGDAEQKFSPTSEILYYINGFTSAFCETNTLETKIYVDKPISLDPPTDTTLCEGSSVTITTDANNGYHYVWTVDRDTLSTSSKMTYKEDEPANVKLEASKGGCSESYDFAINVVPTPHIVSVEESGANAFEVAVEGGSGAYLFDFGDGYQSSSTLSPATYGRTYKVKVKDELGCESDTTIKTPTYELEFPVSFTPNGDGENDVWEIKNIDKYPGATVKIFDRFGKKLCDMKAAEMDAWDGTYNGRALPSTDYWYEIQIDEIDKTYIGHFTLIRN
ncbi:MAG: T9SS type B sorting domain-containing protein [Paludibacteraceae bacterium]|nr:T9SS type B sorting domain-containing protein [Paludibacteraceae bacterium]